MVLPVRSWYLLLILLTRKVCPCALNQPFAGICLSTDWSLSLAPVSVIPWPLKAHTFPFTTVRSQLVEPYPKVTAGLEQPLSIHRALSRRQTGDLRDLQDRIDLHDLRSYDLNELVLC